MKEGFCIIIPTIRPDIFKFRNALFASLTRPSDVFFLEGSDGVIQTYEWGLRHVLDMDRHSWFIKLDDDIKLTLGWQESLLAAFDAIPNLGAAGVDLSTTPEGKAYMGPHPEFQSAPSSPSVRFSVPVGNLAGGLIMTRAWLALDVGSPPVLGGTTYQVYEDSWRCKKIRDRALEIAYIEHPGCEMLQYADDPVYLQKKKDDLAAFHARKLEVRY